MRSHVSEGAKPNNSTFSLKDAEMDFEIHISCDKEAKELIIQDFGVGMTREDLIENLGKYHCYPSFPPTLTLSHKLLCFFLLSCLTGTIARSGSKEFIKTLDSVGSSEAADNIIGQFGVGFYSVFMVADKVCIASSHSSHSLSVLWAFYIKG